MATRVKKNGVALQRLAVDIPVDMHYQLKVFCAINKKSISDVVTEILNNTLSKKEDR